MNKWPDERAASQEQPVHSRVPGATIAVFERVRYAHRRDVSGAAAAATSCRPREGLIPKLRLALMSATMATVMNIRW